MPNDNAPPAAHADATAHRALNATDPTVLRLIATAILLEKPDHLSDVLEAKLCEHQQQLLRELYQNHAQPLRKLYDEPATHALIGKARRMSDRTSDATRQAWQALWEWLRHQPFNDDFDPLSVQGKMEDLLTDALSHRRDITPRPEHGQAVPALVPGTAP